ncbi:hypothetical protein C8A00DRAFT_32644 [Chaetomidium leptoderma]|uniref:Uncharacterized protein n=1 Tax=Chaetomidium leptoderma TaxID=669021 RepID=A0AAN6VN16_9PEZI|nr:hypothetical protein C8A00DRAFT_32644 [Chaetomidium leptoderma]
MIALVFLNVLQSPTPPSLDFFRILRAPSPDDKVWAIYYLLLEKPDGRVALGDEFKRPVDAFAATR